MIERGLEVHEGNAFVDGEAFDLRECRGMRWIEGILAVAHARDHASHRQLLVQQGADLHRAGVGTEQLASTPLTRKLGEVEVERVVLVQRRMVVREVERVEIVPLALGLGAERHDEAELAENAADLVDHAGDWMGRSNPLLAAGHGPVDGGLLGALRCQREFRLPAIDGLLERLLDAIDRCTECPALLGRELGDPLRGGGEESCLPAQHGDVLGLERVGI